MKNKKDMAGVLKRAIMFMKYINTISTNTTRSNVIAKDNSVLYLAVIVI